ncbi:MAG: bifunctional glycosyltransferase family 2/GtrA family protein [Syntrophomonadaceae bacterium]
MKILIPAYEPDKRMLNLIEELKEKTQDQIIVVDDGSGPAYQEIFTAARGMGCTLLRQDANQGKGAALKMGLQYLLNQGESEGMVCADCDGQHSVSDIMKVAAVTREKPGHIILGSRKFAGEVPWRSRLGNTLTRSIFTLATGSRIYDTQTGLRGYSAGMFSWLLKVPGRRYEYELNILLEAQPAGYSVYEIPIATIYEDNNQSSHFHPLFDSIRVYLPLLKFSASSMAAAGIDFVTLLILQMAFGNLLVSVAGARLGSSLFNYLCNRYLVFREGPRHNWSSLLRYYSLAVAILVCNFSMIWLLVNALAVPLIPAKLVTEGILFTISYWVQKKFVFLRPKTNQVHQA